MVTGDASRVAYGVFTLGRGVTCGGAAMLNILVSFFRSTFCLFPNVVNGIVGVVFRRAWVRSASACVSTSFDDILGNFRARGGNFVVSETLYLDILGL